jgi:hypothetical protein
MLSARGNLPISPRIPSPHRRTKTQALPRHNRSSTSRLPSRQPLGSKTHRHLRTSHLRLALWHIALLEHRRAIQRDVGVSALHTLGRPGSLPTSKTDQVHPQRDRHLESER